MPKLGVNIDHVATLREVRKTFEPDPVWAAALAQLGGADGITLHLREDRRHIQDRDLRILRETTTATLNLELACEDDVLRIAGETRPDQATLVPERREEVTTEGGLDVVGQMDSIRAAVNQLQEAGIFVSLFLDPEPHQIDAAKKLGVSAVELHTGQYALANGKVQAAELNRLATAAQQVVDLDMQLKAGHGLNYQNVQPVARLRNMAELNIGHSIVARSIMVGMTQAVREMKALISTE